LHYRDDDFSDAWTGPQAAVILLHGFCRNGELWRGWVPHLARRHRVIRPDLRGCGGSSDPGPGYEYTLDGLVVDLCTLLDALHIAEAHFVGEGLGAVMSTIIATREPSRVRSLTLLSLPTHVGPSVQDVYRLGYATWQEALVEVGVEAWWRRARTLTGDLTGDAALDDYLAAQVGTTPVHVAVGLSRCGTSWDLAQILPHVTAPTLLVGPERTHFTSAEQQAELASLAPHTQLRVYPEIRQQFFMYTDPDAFAPAVAEFIDGGGG
jgi:pimeloyl-ACP methyl ester carboxylesterase